MAGFVMPGQNTSSKKYMSDKWAHYTWQPEECNHSVTILGWDDNYPKKKLPWRTPAGG